MGFHFLQRIGSGGEGGIDIGPREETCSIQGGPTAFRFTAETDAKPLTLHKLIHRASLC